MNKRDFETRVSRIIQLNLAFKDYTGRDCERIADLVASQVMRGLGIEIACTTHKLTHPLESADQEMYIRRHLLRKLADYIAEHSFQELKISQSKSQSSYGGDELEVFCPVITQADNP